MATLATIEALKNFDPAKLSFGSMKKSEAKPGGISSRPSRAPVRYNDSPLRIQTSMLYLPFAYESDPNNSTLSFCTKLTEMNATDLRYAEAMTKVFQVVQEESRKAARDNASEYFGKTPEQFDAAADSFSDPLRVHPEGKYPPHIKVKYYRDDKGLPQFQVYDGPTLKPIHTRTTPCLGFSCPDTFAIGTRHRLIIELSGIWSLNKRGGLTWRVCDDLCYPAVAAFPFKDISAMVEDEPRRAPSAYKPPPMLVDDTDMDGSELDEGDIDDDENVADEP